MLSVSMVIPAISSIYKVLLAEVDRKAIGFTAISRGNIALHRETQSAGNQVATCS